MARCGLMKRLITISLVLCLFSICVSSCSSNASSFDPDNDKILLSPPSSLPMYNVIFDYNDGSGRSKAAHVPEGKDFITYAPQVIEGNKEVVGCSSSSDGNEMYQLPITQDITLYAQWQSCEITTYTHKNLPDTLEDRFVEINLHEGNNSSLRGKILRISPSVRSVSFISSGIEFENFGIYIAERGNDIKISLNQFLFTHYNNRAIEAESSSDNSYTVQVEVLGNNTIDCSQYAVYTSNRSYACIYAPSLEIYGTGQLSLYARNGERGETWIDAEEGHDGHDGGNGQNGGTGIIAESIVIRDITLLVQGGNGGMGGNGANGKNGSTILGPHYKDGGNGGNGGNGGAAIECTTFIAQNATLKLLGGNGGDGGHGGIAGENALIFDEDQKKLYAGHGGNGGNSGNGGNVFFSLPSVFQVQNCSQTLQAGKFGAEVGKGGASLHDGKHGSVGKSGSDGISNAPAA